MFDVTSAVAKIDFNDNCIAALRARHPDLYYVFDALLDARDALVAAEAAHQTALSLQRAAIERLLDGVGEIRDQLAGYERAYSPVDFAAEALANTCRYADDILHREASATP